MAEKKKLSVAEILAAARKSDASERRGRACRSPRPHPLKKLLPRPLLKLRRLQTRRSLLPSPRQTGRWRRANEREPRCWPPPALKKQPAQCRKTAAAKTAPDKPAPAAKKESPAAKPMALLPRRAAAKASPKPEPARAGRQWPERHRQHPGRGPHRCKAGPDVEGRSCRQGAQRRPRAPEKPRAVVPPMPVKPDYAKPKPAKVAADEGRRGFLTGVMLGSFLGLGFTSLATTLGLWALGTARFMFPNMLTEPPSKFKVGFPSEFRPRPGRDEVQGAVRRVGGQLRIQRPARDLRPAHGVHAPGLHAELAGRRAEVQVPLPRQRVLQGRHQLRRPRPAPLERYAIRVADDGQLEVDKSKHVSGRNGAVERPSIVRAV